MADKCKAGNEIAFRGFSQIHNIGNNANIGIGGFTM